MGAELGRISGPLLAPDLIRHGIDLAFETDLLYLYVSDNDPANFKVGIKTDSPGFLLDVANTLTSVNFIVDNTLTVPNFDIHTNEIQNLTGPIYITPTGQTLDGILDGGLSGTISFVDDADGGGAGTLIFNPVINGGNSMPFGSAPEIRAPALTTDNLKITDQLIKNFVVDSDIELNPIGTGIVRFNTFQVNVNGSLHATGDVTFDGFITFGSDDSDSVTFTSDIESHIIPDEDNTYDLGSALKRWSNLYSTNVNADTLTVDSLVIDNINLLLTQGNTIYVSQNGNDTNYGDHLHSTFRTVKKALEVAEFGDTIIVFPGTYEEVFPLTVPAGVSLKGASLRSTTIRPTLATNTQDAFLLNGDTTVEFLAIKDFFYDSVNDTGYAFKFAPGFSTLARSPYIQHVSVITTGSVTSASDPRGFNQGDAGRGGYFDGSVASNTSNQIPTALFFSATFITPNADALTLTNGVRCEWLNSFSYFANRGIYLLNGTAGRYNDGVTFETELRSINSANIYGNYGIVADGANTLAYIIGHNFGYIGTGADATNDPKLAIQANEVIKLNDGVVYFDSTDHLGDIRVGDIFYVSQATGLIAFDASSIDVGAGGNLTFEGPTSSTTIDELRVETGNIRIYGNTIASLTGPVNFLANSGTNTTYFNTDVDITGNLIVSNDLAVDGNVYFGSDSADLITINPYLTQDINPGTTDTFYLGSTSYRWNTLYTNLLDVDGVTQITGNEISTISTNTDLELIANGSGRLYISSNDVQIDNNLDIDLTLTVNGSTTLQDTEIVGTTTLVGDLNQTDLLGTEITGTFANHNISITGSSSSLILPEITLTNNSISVTSTDTDLVLSGTDGVRAEKLKFVDNNIFNNWTGATTDSQKSVILTPTGTGSVVINTTHALKLPIGSNTNETMSTVGTVRFNNSRSRYEGYSPNGAVSFNNLYSYNSTGSSYTTSAITNVVAVTTVSVTVGLYTAQLSSTAGLSVGYRVVSGPGLAYGATITNIDGNVITLDLPNTVSTTGIVYIGSTVLYFALVAGLQVGQAVTGTHIQPGTTVLSWTSTSVTLSLPVASISPIGNVITFGTVNATYITPELTPGANDNTFRFGIAGNVKATLNSTAFYSVGWNITNISISANNISNLTSNDLLLAPDSGLTNINSVHFEDDTITNTTNSALSLATTGQGYVKFTGTGAVVFPAGLTSERRLNPELGEIRYNTELGYLEVYNSTSWIPSIGTTGAASLAEVEAAMDFWSLVLG